MSRPLSWIELGLAANVGVTRRLKALERQRPEPWGKPPGDHWGVDIEAAAAEMLVAKTRGLYWHALADKPADLPADTGRNFQVRHTTLVSGCLILHPSDPDDAVFVLVVGSIPHLRIAGSILGAEGKQPDLWYIGTGRPAYFVPQAQLAPWGTP